MQKLSLKFQLKHHKESIYCVAFSSDSQLLVSGGSDKTCYLISLP
jgi:WD40 repeat protein